MSCISEEFVTKNKEELQECPTPSINGVTLVSLIRGKTVRLNKKIHVDVQLPDHIQVVFLVVPKLSRSCIIGMHLDNKTISFPHLKGKPSIRIMNEETTIQLTEKKGTT